MYLYISLWFQLNLLIVQDSGVFYDHRNPDTPNHNPNGPKWSQMDVVGSIPRRDLVTEISDILPKKHNTVRFAKNILYDSIFLEFSPESIFMILRLIAGDHKI